MSSCTINQLMVRNDDAEHTKLLKVAAFLKPKNKCLGTVDFHKIISIPKELAIEAGTRGIYGLKLYQRYIKERKALEISNVVTGAVNEEANRRIADLNRKYEKLVQDDPEVWELGKKYYNNILKFDVPNWYEWVKTNWGTRTNAYECVPWKEGMDRLQFNTVWNPVIQLMARLSMIFPEIEFCYRWADIELGRNTGEIIFKNGKKIEEYLPLPGSKEACEMSAEMIGADLKEMDYPYIKEKGTHIYNGRLEEPKQRKSSTRGKKEER